MGETEANDVLNSIRAAQRMPRVDADSNLVLWEHSHGGQSVLWTIRPELRAGDPHCGGRRCGTRC